MRDDLRYELATLLGWGLGFAAMALTERAILSRAVVSYAERLCREAAREPA